MWYSVASDALVRPPQLRRKKVAYSLTPITSFSSEELLVNHRCVRCICMYSHAATYMISFMRTTTSGAIRAVTENRSTGTPCREQDEESS